MREFIVQIFIPSVVIAAVITFDFIFGLPRIAEIGLMILLLGTFLNLSAQLANHGRMPVFLKDRRIRHTPGSSSCWIHTIGDHNTRLSWLGDHFSLPFNLPGVWSIGDFFNLIGSIIFLIGILI